MNAASALFVTHSVCDFQFPGFSDSFEEASLIEFGP